MSVISIALLGASAACCTSPPELPKEAVVQKSGSYIAVPYIEYSQPRLAVYQDLAKKASAVQQQLNHAETQKRFAPPLTIRVSGGAADEN